MGRYHLSRSLWVRRHGKWFLRYLPKDTGPVTFNEMAAGKVYTATYQGHPVPYLKPITGPLFERGAEPYPLR